METRVTLTWAEMTQGCLVEVMRHIQNRRKGNKNRVQDAQLDGWGGGIEGACAEMALAKLLGFYWSGAIGNPKAADVGRLQVRQTVYLHGRLRLHDWDSDDDKFVLMVGEAPTFEARGWCYGREGKKKRHKADPTGRGIPAFFVPQKCLRAMTTLFEEGNEHEYRHQAA